MHKVRPIPIYVDSPLATRLTEIHRDYPAAYTPFARSLMDKDPLYFGSKYVEFCAGWDDSRRLNHLNGPMVIISSAGMCEAGRIRHHLRHVVSDPDNAIVIVSYQAEGTLGRAISDGVERVQIFDQWYDLNAAVYVLDGFSGHADRGDLSLVVRTNRRPNRARLSGARRARVDRRARALASALRRDAGSHARAPTRATTSEGSMSKRPFALLTLFRRGDYDLFTKVGASSPVRRSTDSYNLPINVRRELAMTTRGRDFCLLALCVAVLAPAGGCDGTSNEPNAPPELRNAPGPVAEGSGGPAREALARAARRERVGRCGKPARSWPD